ncbi:MAG: alpha/beta hydrolase [Acetobacteraceae bacterium]|nr:alpha/beta hydrolase [Acetobacteraceae bacterium]
MPVDPEIQEILDAMAGLPPSHTLSVAENRLRMEQRPREGLRIPPLARVETVTIAGPGGPLAVRVYTPHGVPGEQGVVPFPMLVFFHGSGFVVCSLDTHDILCRNLCAGSGAIVVSVDYRLAPEHKFPAGLEDCLHATRWAASEAVTLNADPRRIAVGGDSAGGNLATVTAIRIRDQGGLALSAQLLLYPVTDYCEPGTPSYRENAEGYGLTAKQMAWFFGHYLPHPGEAANPLVSPLRTDRLAGLPPALIYTAEYDVLRDEAERYAGRLGEAGVPVTLHRWHGMNHGFMQWAGRVNRATEAVDAACAWLRERLRSDPAGHAR